MLSPLDIARRRFASQYLAEPTLRSPADVVGWLGAVQAQDYLAAKWGVAQRTAEPKDAAVEKALNAGTILRTHVLRPTWHFVRERDIRWMLALTAPRVIAASAYYLRKLELDDAVVRRSRTALNKRYREASTSRARTSARRSGGRASKSAGPVWRVPWVARPARVMPSRISGPNTRSPGSSRSLSSTWTSGIPGGEPLETKDNRRPGRSGRGSIVASFGSFHQRVHRRVRHLDAAAAQGQRGLVVVERGTFRSAHGDHGGPGLARAEGECGRAYREGHAAGGDVGHRQREAAASAEIRHRDRHRAALPGSGGHCAEAHADGIQRDSSPDSGEQVLASGADDVHFALRARVLEGLQGVLIGGVDDR